MTNIQHSIIIAVRSALAGLAQLVGVYPQDIGKLGNNETGILVQAGDEVWTPEQGNTYLLDMTMRVHAYALTGVNPLLSVTALQAAVQTALLADVTLGGVIRCVTPVSAEVGEWMTEIDYHTVGVSDGYQHRTITYNCRALVAR